MQKGQFPNTPHGVFTEKAQHASLFRSLRSNLSEVSSLLTVVFGIHTTKKKKKKNCLNCCTNSSTFVTSAETKRFTVVEVAWPSSVIHLRRRCCLCSRALGGTGPEGFSYCRATFRCQCHHPSRFPRCLVQLVSPWNHSPACCAGRTLLDSSPAVSTTTVCKIEQNYF